VSVAGARISPDDAAQRARGAGRSIEDLMTSLLPWGQSFARAPVSQFTVGAVALGRSGALYAGANLELAGLPLSASVHAEQSAVSNAWLHGESGLVALAVSAPPCGHCRQFLNELDGAAGLRIVVAGAPPATLAELLPRAFGPLDLGVTARLMLPEDHQLTLDARDADPLSLAALAAAGASYAPYTGAFAAAALRLRNGSVVTGRYAECAAYNPSLPALQAALAAVTLRGEAFSLIAEAVLVEADGRTSQRASAEAVLAGLGVPPARYLRADTLPGQDGS
jgi:cytidine deaminase